MSETRQLAEFAARITDLTAQLADRDRKLATSEAAAQVLTTALAAAKNDAAAASEALAAAQTGFQVSLADAGQQLATVSAARDKALADHADVAAKLDRLMGTPAEPGISIFQKYRTDADNAEHPTLAAARLHRAAITLGISTAEARRIGEVAKANPDAVKMLMEAAG